MELLLWNGAKTSEIDYQGRTSLHHATRAKFIAGVVLLLKHGSNVNIADFSGKTALDYAVEMQLADLATLLRLAQLAETERSPQSRAAFEEALASYEVRSRDSSSDLSYLMNVFSNRNLSIETQKAIHGLRPFLRLLD